MTKAEIQTLVTDSGCIESCLSTKTMLAIIVHLVFESGGILPATEGIRITDDGSIRIASDDFIRIVSL